MNTYHKIQTVFKRDPETKFKTLLEEQYSMLEFEFLQHNEWVWTEKIDGTNIRVIYDGFIEAMTPSLNPQIKGKTDNAQIPIFLLEKLQSIFLPQKLSEIFDSQVCLYGEGYGARIQKGGGNYRADNGFVLFDIKVGDWWLKREDVEKIAGQLNLEVAPIIGTGDLLDMVERVRDGFNSQWGDFIAEGIVARPAVELKARDGRRIITKIKYKDFARQY